MRRQPATVIALLLPTALAGAVRGAEPAGSAPANYECRQIEGFTVHVNKVALSQPRDRWARTPLSVLERELNDLRRLLNPTIFATLQRDAPLWVEWNERVPSPFGDKGIVLAHYHPLPTASGWKGPDAEKQAEEWLRVMRRLNPKAGCVEVCSLRLLCEVRQPGSARQQVMLLHEMAHAVQDRFVGWNHPDLLAAYRQAVDRRLYDSVNDRSGRRVRAYARTNADEYFAEISCAYLDSCNFFPFSYSDLFNYDPAGFAFVERVWKHPERVKSGGGKPIPPEPSVFAERAAQLKLDRLKAKAKEGAADELRNGLADLVREFPGTAAAAEARQLLKAVR